jgi:ribosome-associated protein
MKEDLIILNTIAQVIFDKKGVNILCLDVRKISTMTDYYIIAEGTVDRHTLALAKTIQHSLKEIDQQPLHVEGDQSGDWIILDYSNIVIHLFIPEMREKFALEELYKEGKIVDLHIEVEKENFPNKVGEKIKNL